MDSDESIALIYQEEAEKELAGLEAGIQANMDQLMKALDMEHKNLVRMADIRHSRGKPSEQAREARE